VTARHTHLRRRLADLPADGAREWELVEHGLEPEQRAAREAVFAVGNGYLGIRGTPEEGGPAHDAGAILNGFHETWPIVYPEDAYGLARTGQTIVSATDGSIIRLAVDGESFDATTARVLRYERALDMRTGVLSREVEFETARGARMLVRSRRLASLEDRHLAALDYEVVALDAAVHIDISSELVTHGASEGSDDPRRGKGLAETVLEPIAAHAVEARALLHLATRRSGLELACGMDHDVEAPSPVTVETSALGDGARVAVSAELRPGERVRLRKYVAYHWGPEAPAGELLWRADRTLDRARRAGYGRIERAHARRVADFWRRSDVRIEGAPDLQQVVRFNLFALLQATARGEGLGVPAKGVTGHGYEGHYFWDTEVYVLPFLIHTNPEWARQALDFRVRMLGAARRRAQEVGHTGALYPWRTINGEEASAFYAAGTAQYHINADIAYAMHQYNRVTGDLGFLLDQGAEVLVETARFWMRLGFFSERRDGQFCIHGVTGPDEYTTVVDNNAYTNLMAKENLEVATRIVEWLQGADPAAHADLVAATGLRAAEVDGWRRASELMYVPRDERVGVVLQDDRFLDRKRWDFDGTPPDKHPLLLHYHPLEIYRHQVIKQTDVVLATYLVGRGFNTDEKRRTFDYYDPLTTGDSSLSACVQSVMASEVGYAGLAFGYFLDACAVDVLDLHDNTADGIHIASCGGTWLALVAGFGGLRDADGELRFSPRLPAEWDRLAFRVQVRGQLIEVDMTAHETTYRLLDGTGIQIVHHDEELRLLRGRPVSRAAETGDAADLPLAA
jgi:alpha,alpha-trehalose phosphorylase